jgi:hypothetical protein
VKELKYTAKGNKRNSFSFTLLNGISQQLYCDRDSKEETDGRHISSETSEENYELLPYV